ncbi:hypothetical protein [Sodalinema gerasimenkoae]|uniref:hypothetical protein n=1 Tax=Sodalinema gerasimenkoae TaxID=2862348 RepID=UPI00135CC608|nr:hypothetical protein [Sodalinema gerasimenkoae]
MTRINLLYHSQKWLNATSFIVLIFNLCLFTALYIASEKTYYWSDFINYQHFARYIFDIYQDSRLDALTLILGSRDTTSYNLLFTVPLLPVFDIFGLSRFTYILSLVLIYLLPFSLSLGAVATQLINAPARSVFWGTVFLSLLSPFTLATSLRGLPDTGGMTLICLGIFIYLKSHELSAKVRLPTIVTLMEVGLLFAGAIAFRRHFAYSVVAFLGAMLMWEVMSFWRWGFGAIVATILRGTTIALSAFLVLAIAMPNFLQDSLSRDYRSLYASFTYPVGEVLSYYGNGAGWLLWGLAILGWLTIQDSQRGAFPFLFGLWEIGLWLGVVRYTHVHYTLHFAPFLVWGIAALIWETRRVGVLVWMLVGLNAIIGLTPLSLPQVPGLAQGYPPLIREDIAQVDLLVAALRDMPQPVYVAASSDSLNPDLIRSAERQVYGDDLKLAVLRVPQVDSSDEYPLGALLQAQTVVVPDSFQHSLRPDEQMVVRVVSDAFNQEWTLIRDFLRLNRRFNLSDVEVRLYRRVRDTDLATAIQTLANIQEAIAPRYEGHQQWVSVPPGARIHKTEDTYEISGDTPLSLLYLSPQEMNALDGELASTCQEGQVQLRRHNQDGEAVQQQEFPLTDGSFTYPLPPITSPTYLSLSLTSDPSCSLNLTLKH